VEGLLPIMRATSAVVSPSGSASRRSRTRSTDRAVAKLRPRSTGRTSCRASLFCTASARSVDVGPAGVKKPGMLANSAPPSPSSTVAGPERDADASLGAPGRPLGHGLALRRRIRAHATDARFSQTEGLPQLPLKPQPEPGRRLDVDGDDARQASLVRETLDFRVNTYELAGVSDQRQHGPRVHKGIQVSCQPIADAGGRPSLAGRTPANQFSPIRD
jgi:hypothetical protein